MVGFSKVLAKKPYRASMTHMCMQIVVNKDCERVCQRLCGRHDSHDKAPGKAENLPKNKENKNLKN